jgi:ubiquitin C-terminal hydrolase
MSCRVVSCRCVDGEQEAGDKPHEVAAAEAWERHLARNRSAVIDIMHAQLRSTVSCPTEGCGRVSVTFDPYQVVTLPLPVNSGRILKVTLFA